MKWILALFAALAVTAQAADISGTWKGTAETQNGTFERTFVFKAEGNKLTGETTSERLGKSVIENGKIEGDTISFTIKVNLQGSETTLKYTGKVSGNEAKLDVEGGNGMRLQYNIKKVS